MHARVRRLLTGLAGTVAASLTLAACSGTAPDPSGGDQAGGQTTIRFLWWGNDNRNALTQQVIDLYEAKNPSVKIEAQSADWGSYWQLLSTQLAGGDAPDVIQMDLQYLAEYASQGALLDLGSQTIDTADWAPGAVEDGTYDGTFYAAMIGLNAPVIIANPAVFDKAGVALPDDKTWTWADLAALASEIQAKGNGEYFGVQNLGVSADVARAWLRQNGSELFSSDGVGFSATDITPYFQYWLDLQAAQGTAGATTTIEQSTTAIDQQLLATSRLALGFQWSSQLSAVEKSSGQEMTLLRLPSQTGNAADAKLWFKPGMYLSASGTTQHPAEAADFINFFINDPEAGAILGVERGVPVNTTIQEQIAPSLDSASQKVVAFMDAISGELGSGGAIPGPGSSNFSTAFGDAGQQVLLGQQAPAAAAEALFVRLGELGLAG